MSNVQQNKSLWRQNIMTAKKPKVKKKERFRKKTNIFSSWKKICGGQQQYRIV